MRKCKGKEHKVGPSYERKWGGSSTGTLTPLRDPKLWKPTFSIVELGQQVTTTDTFKEHDTCFALGQAIMLPQDVDDLAKEDFCDLMVMQYV